MNNLKITIFGILGLLTCFLLHYFIWHRPLEPWYIVFNRSSFMFLLYPIFVFPLLYSIFRNVLRFFNRITKK